MINTAPNSLRTNLIIGIGDTSFVITKQKVGSRFIKTYYENNIEVVVDNKFTIDYLNKSTVIDELTNTNQTDKDIIILYRNPHNRYISGIIQDILLTLSDNLIKYYTLTPYLQKHNIHVNEFNINKRTNHSDILKLLKIKKFENFFKNLINDYFMWQIDGSKIIHTVHVSPYLFIYDSIIKNEKINLDKSCFINIDDTRNDLKKIFLKYNVKSFKTDNTKSNKDFFNFIDSIIRDNKKIYDFVSTLNKNEYDSFLNLEKSKFNIIHKNNKVI